MRIKTQFLVCLIVFTIILSIISVSVAATEQQVDYLNGQQEIANNIERGSSSLNSIAIDYFLYQEDLQLSRWEETLSSLSGDLGNIRVGNVDQQTLVDNVASDLQVLGTQFDEVVVYLQNSPRNVSVRIDPAFQFRWSSMALQIQNLAFDASQLSKAISSQAHQLNTANILLILSLVGTFGAFLATVYLIVFRRTLKSVTKLQKGINTIGTGNLDYIIEIEGQNEITQLSHAFNQMTSNLKTVTASKAELENVKVKLEEKAAEVEEYANSMEDLAEQRASQLKDAERLAAIGMTAGMVGHDIRNPLQAIIGDIYLANADLASMPDSEEKDSLKESLEAIVKSAEYINKIVADLQDFAKPLSPCPEETDLKLVVDDLIRKNGLPENIQSEIEVGDDARKVMADSAYLKRILGNLVSNAVQAMPDGGKLKIQAYREAADVVITVEDTGVGIPDDVKPKLFTPLFTTKSRGQGFGLAVVKRLTEALNGTVTFQSHISKGTKFIIRLPPK